MTQGGWGQRTRRGKQKCATGIRQVRGNTCTGVKDVDAQKTAQSTFYEAIISSQGENPTDRKYCGLPGLMYTASAWSKRDEND